MITAQKGREDEADTHSIDGSWTASNESKAQQHQRGPGIKRKGINDKNCLKSGTPTTEYRLLQRMKRNGGRERQNASKQVVGRQYRQDDPGTWTQEENKGLNSASTKTNYLLQGAEDPSATEVQCISGLETEKTRQKIRAGKYILHTIYTVHTVRIEREKEKKKMNHAQEAYTASV